MYIYYRIFNEIFLQLLFSFFSLKYSLLLNILFQNARLFKKHEESYYAIKNIFETQKEVHSTFSCSWENDATFFCSTIEWKLEDVWHLMSYTSFNCKIHIMRKTESILFLRYNNMFLIVFLMYKITMKPKSGATFTNK